MKLIDKIKSFFKKKEIVILPKPKTEKEIEFDRIRKEYELDFSESLNLYFIKYQFNHRWYYLRRWDFDFGLEESRGNCIVIRNTKELDEIIREHQEWLKGGAEGGRVFLPFK